MSDEPPTDAIEAGHEDAYLREQDQLLTRIDTDARRIAELEGEVKAKEHLATVAYSAGRDEEEPYRYILETKVRLAGCLNIDDLEIVVNKQVDLITKLEGEVERLRNSLTPSADTKAKYSGEFRFDVFTVDHEGDEVGESVLVPWTTIKEIMQMIKKEATDAE